MPVYAIKISFRIYKQAIHSITICMNKLSTYIKLLSLLLIGLGIASCADDELSSEPEIISPASVKFNDRTIGLSELGGTSEILINLDKAATKNGTIIITVETLSSNSFTTAPAISNNQLILPVTSGQESVKFQFTPTDNNLHDENQFIDFTITQVSDGFTIGSEKTLRLTILENDLPTLVGFSDAHSTLLENRDGDFFVPILFSLQAPGEGIIEVSLGSATSLYGVYFTTEPVAVNGKIHMNVAAGAGHVFMKVKPINNFNLNGHKEIEFTITDASGAIEKGTLLSHRLSITDDELAGKAKGYRVGSNNGWSIQRTYEYNEQGLVSRILWEQNTPGQLTGSYTYSYNNAGQVTEMLESSNYKTIYTWENERIIKSEKYREGVLQSYSTYGYDDAGNVGETAVFYRQENGELKMGLLFVYLYFNNGNIYKQLAHSPIEGSEEYALLSTKTYDNYLAQSNPFTMVDILPTVDTMINLPGTYREETNGHDFLYQFTYEFDAAGRPTKRVASSGTSSETAYYEYY